MSDQNAADRWGVQDVLSNYTMGIDERDMVQYRNCFTDDVEVVGFGTEVYNDGDVWIEYVTKALKAYGATQHMLGPMFAQIDGDNAKTRTDVQALHYLIDDPKTTLTLWATYVTDMKRIDGQWKISRHELVSRGKRIQTDQQ